MKRTNFWQVLERKFSKKGEKVIKTTGEMAQQLERMGKLGGQLFVMRVG